VTSAQRKLAGISLVVITFIVLCVYVFSHPEIFSTLLRVSPFALMAILFLYFMVIGIHFSVMHATIRLCDMHLPLKKGMLLTAYSTLVNFFGPLQSGPGVRAVYLKRTIGLRVRDYTMVTLLYYFIYAAISGSLLFAYISPPLTFLGWIVGAIAAVVGVRWWRPSSSYKWMLALVGMTVVQVLLLSAIYYIELHATGLEVQYSYAQVLVYTGSANLSLFVSITPGAIGIREAFLVLSQSLHHIPVASIVAASIVDRSMYVVLLALLLVATSGTHLRDMFTRK